MAHTSVPSIALRAELPDGVSAPVASVIPIETSTWLRPEITSEHPPFLPMVLRGYGFILLTLGLYRFWLTRDTRRWYRSHVKVEGDRFEYLGTAEEHLRGFLVGLVIATPINAAYFFGPLALGVLVGEIAAWIAVFLMSYLATYAGYRAERFRWVRTSWRGIRFGLEGSPWAYANRMAAWQLLTIVTLGLAYPWQSAASLRMRFGNLRYGSVQGKIEIYGRQLIGSWLAFWFGGLVLTGVLILIMVTAFAYMPMLPDFSELPTGVQVSLCASMMILSFLFVWPLYATEELRIAMESFSLGSLRFRSQLSVWDIFGQYVVYALILSAVMSVIFSAAANGWLPEEDRTDWARQSVYVATSMGIGLAMAYVVGIARELLVTRVFWRACIASVEYTGLEALLPEVTAVNDNVTAVGEGFLDALDA